MTRALAAGGALLLFVSGFAAGRFFRSEPDAPPAPIATNGRLEAVPAGPELDSEVESNDVTATTGLTVEALEAALAEIDLAEISFEPHTEELTTEGRSVVAELAAVLVDRPFIPVEVEVMVYSEATPGKNHGLSVGMAEAIGTALVVDGVSPDRLTAVGLGSAVAPEALRGEESTALALDTADGDLAAALDGIDTSGVTLNAAGDISVDGRRALDRVAAELIEHRSAPLRLIGYGYAESPAASHDRSHELVDAVAGYLDAVGVDPARLSTVGLGDAVASLDRAPVIELEVGAPAAISLALDAVENEVEFERHTARLTERGMAAVADLAAAMALDPASSIEISVHTYTELDSQRNHDLSHRQGDAIVAALGDNGIDPSRLDVVGHGDPPHFAQDGRETYITYYARG